MTTATPATPTPLTPADFASDQDIRWCPGCGDYAILQVMKKVLPQMGVPRENTVFISGEIPRVTAFEKGMPGQHRLDAAGAWTPDELLADERFVAVHLAIENNRGRSRRLRFARHLEFIRRDRLESHACPSDGRVAGQED